MPPTSTHPPFITPTDPRYPGHDLHCQHPTDRELPFWTETVMPALRQ